MQFCLCLELHDSTLITNSTCKNIVVELNKGEKLNGDNYEIWSMKIQYVLGKHEFLGAFNIVLVKPKVGDTTQHKKD